MIKGILAFILLIGIAYSSYTYISSLDADELENFISVTGKVTAVLAVCIILVVCIIMIF